MASLTNMSVEDLAAFAAPPQVVDTKLIDAMDGSLKASFALLTSSAPGRDSVFAGAPDKSGKAVAYRSELEEYRQEVEQSMREFVAHAKALESELLRVDTLSSQTPTRKLKDEIASLRNDLKRKDQLLAVHTAKVQLWLQQISEIQAAQSVHLESAAAVPSAVMGGADAS